MNWALKVRWNLGVGRGARERDQHLQSPGMREDACVQGLDVAPVAGAGQTRREGGDEARDVGKSQPGEGHETRSRWGRAGVGEAGL